MKISECGYKVPTLSDFSASRSTFSGSMPLGTDLDTTSTGPSAGAGAGAERALINW